MKPPGTREGQELWVRCWECGDGSSLLRAHLSVNLRTGLYHCYRCNTGGRLTPELVLSLAEASGVDTDSLFFPTESAFPSEIDPVDRTRAIIEPGAGSSRPSALSRYHASLPDRGLVDIFESRDIDGLVLGYQLRPPKGDPWGKALMVGRRGFGYSGPNLQGRYLLRLVEGPYDALEPTTDVCTWGFPNRSQLRKLLGYSLVLCPDGDVWEDSDRLCRYARPFLEVSGLVIVGVEQLAPGLDPDQVPLQDRKEVSWSYVKEMIRRYEDQSEKDPLRRGSGWGREERSASASEGQGLHNYRTFLGDPYPAEH